MTLPVIQWPAVLAALICLLPLAWGLRAKARGRTWPAAALTFLALPLWTVFQLFFTSSSLVSLLVELGLALLAGAALLRLWRSSARIFAVPGVVCLLLATVLQLGSALFNARLNAEKFFSRSKNLFRSEVKEPRNPATAVLLVELGPDDRLEEIKPILQRFDAVARRAFAQVDLSEDEDLAQVYRVEVPEGVADALKAALRADSENVDHVARDRELSLWPLLPTQAVSHRNRTAPTDDPRLNEQWGLEATGGLAALERLKTLQPVRRARLAIVDTGIDGSHEDLSTDRSARDPVGHGTHCAGIAAAVADNGKGIASFNIDGRWIELRNYPALGNTGNGPLSMIANAIIQAGEDGCDVISLSLGALAIFDQDRVLHLAVNYARSLGSIVVAAAGNESRPARSFVPASIPGVICVTATAPDGHAASFTNTTGGIDQPIAAPGVGILSLRPGSGYMSAQGTSMACPYVAGVLAIIRALRPGIRADAAYDLVARTAADHPDAPRIGRLIRVDRALQALQEGV